MKDSTIEKRVQMRRTVWIDGFPVSFSRSIVGWVAVIGEAYAIHIRKPEGSSYWFVKRPFALEPIAKGITLTEAFRNARTRYNDERAEAHARICRLCSEGGMS